MTTHLNEIFTFFARGAKRFYDRGTGSIKVPECAQAYKQEYVKESDIVQQFIEENESNIVVDKSLCINRNDLYDYFITFFRSNKELESSKIPKASKFREMLREKGYEVDKQIDADKKKGTKKHRAVIGLGIKKLIN